MRRLIILAGAAGVGAGLMYLFDPDRGRKRRAMLRNKGEHARRIAVHAAGKTHRDVRNHVRGLVSEVESLWHTTEVTDDILQARVRSKMGRVVSHPHAVHVALRDGHVILRGSILAEEVHPLLNAIARIAGVKNIENWLEVHESADVSALQGGHQRRRARFGPFKTNWSPTTRLVATVAGGAIAIHGVKRRGLIGSGLGVVGTALATRALTNVEIRKLVGFEGDVVAQRTEPAAQPAADTSPQKVGAQAA